MTHDMVTVGFLAFLLGILVGRADDSACAARMVWQALARVRTSR